jgi:hypothetical protein
VRIAALFLGMIAGLFALLAPSALRIDLLSPFLEFWTATSNERLLGTIIWYAIAGAAMLGGLLATVTPGFAAMLLLGAAVGWLGIAVSVPQLLTYQLLGPAGAAAIAALFAFLAGELQVRRRRLARRSRKLAAEVPDTDSEFEREAALRMDPLLMPRQDVPPPPRRHIPLTLDDVAVTSRPAGEPPRWQDLDQPQPARRHDPDLWAEARREQLQPAPEVQRARVVPEPRPELREREPHVREREPQVREREPQIREREPQLREREPQVRRAEPRPEPRREPPRQRDQRSAEGTRVWVAALAAVGAVLGLAVIAAGGYLITRDGSLGALFGEPGAPTVVASSEAPPLEPVATPPAESKPATPASLQLPATPTARNDMATLPSAPATGVPAATVPATPAAAATAPAIAVAPLVSEPPTAPAQIAATPPQGYDDPFAYCRAVGTVDYVDYRYTGPATVAAITNTLLIPAGSARDRVRWRCFDGAVLACTSYIGPICDMAPTVVEMREFCERNPNVEQLLAPSGTWACIDGKPQLPANASWPVDARGFLPQGWIAVTDPKATGAG